MGGTRVNIYSCGNRFSIRVEITNDDISVYVFSGSTLVASSHDLSIIDELIQELKSLKNEILNVLNKLRSGEEK